MIPGKTFVMGLVAAGCIAAAGVGAYVAVRAGSSNSSAAPASPQTSVTGIERPADAPPVATPGPTDVIVPSSPARVESESARTDAVASRPTPPRPADRPVPQTPQTPTIMAGADPAAAPASSVDDAAPAPPVTSTADSTAVPVEMRPEVDEIVVNRDSVIGIRLDTPISSETARVEDRVSARVTRDVTVDGRTAIPAGAVLEGTVTVAQRAGRLKERARLGIRFTSMTLADNLTVPIQTETIFREGEAPGGETTSKIGASAVVGAILGAVIGGKKGAAIGGTAGAAGGTAAVMASDRNEVTMPAGAPLTVRLTAPASVVISKNPS